MENGLTKEHSKMMQGIAVIMMLYFHLFKTDFPEHISVLNIMCNGLEIKIACIGRICTAIFAMVSGYGMTKSCQSVSKDNIKIYFEKAYKKVFKHLYGFYKMYWLVFIIFIPFRFVITDKGFHIVEFLSNLIGYTYEYNPSWWYVHQYVVMMLLFPVVNYILFNVMLTNNIMTAISCIFGIVILAIPVIRDLILQLYEINCISYMVVFVFAMLIARYDGFIVFNNVLKKVHLNNMIFSVVMLVAICVFRVIVTGSDIIAHQWDFILTPLFTYCIIMIFKGNRSKAILNFFGKHSMYIWLTHTFYYLVYFKKLFELLRFSFLMYTVLMAVSVMTSIILMYIYNGISRIGTERKSICQRLK